MDGPFGFWPRTPKRRLSKHDRNIDRPRCFPHSGRFAWRFPLSIGMYMALGASAAWAMKDVGLAVFGGGTTFLILV